MKVALTCVPGQRRRARAPEPAPQTRSLAEIARRLTSTLRRKGQTAESAEDIVQDAMLKFEVYRRNATVLNDEAFITRTALNLAIDAGRRARRSPICGDPLDQWDLADPGPDQLARYIACRQLDRLGAGLAALDAKTQSMLLAHRLDGLSYAEIARRNRVSESAVVKRVARGVLFLQKWVEQEA